jgi:tight adherence protein B
MTGTLFALLGAGLGCGLYLIIRGLRPGPMGRRVVLRLPRERHAVRATAAIGAGAAGGVVTGWVVGGILITLAAWSLPTLLTRDTARARRIARIEAVATWTEMLRDTLAAAAGLEQAILASATVAPEALHDEITELAVRLERGHRLAPSLRQLADDLADPTADLVIAALLLAATQQARNLGDLLGSLAAAAREQASLRLRIEAGRARTRTSVRIIVTTTLTFAGLLVLLNRDYLTVYDSLTGQLVLLVIGGLFAVGFVALAKIATVDEPARLLPTTSELAPAGGS